LAGSLPSLGGRMAKFPVAVLESQISSVRDSFSSSAQRCKFSTSRESILGTRTRFSGACVIEAIAGATNTQAASALIAKILLQKFLAARLNCPSLATPAELFMAVFLAVPFLQFLTASRAARNAKPGEEQPLAEWVKRGGACLCAHGHSFPSTSRPGPPTGVLASGAR